MKTLLTLLVSLVVLCFGAAAFAQAAPAQPPPDPGALAAVAKAWSLPAPAPGAPAFWPGARLADAAAATFLWKSGGPPPTEGWKLHQSEKTWEAAARKAGVAVDDLLASYRSKVGEKDRRMLTAEGGEWTVLAELKTLERLTGRNLRTLAAEMSDRGFEGMLARSAPAGGEATRRSAEAPDPGGAPEPPGGVSMNPLQPELEKAPQDNGMIGDSGEVKR